MTVARVHKLALTAAVTVALFGMLQGSPRLALAAVATMAIAWATASRLHRRRPGWLHVAVHAATVVLLFLAIAVFREERIDGALLIVMLGVANRFLLRGGHRDDLILVGAAAVLVAATTTITPGLPFVLIVSGFVPTALWALWSATLLASHPDVGRRPAPKQMRTIAMWSLGLMVTGFGVVALLPRYHFSRLLSPGYFMQLAGATRSMDLQVGGVRPPGGGAAVLQIDVADGVGSGRVEGLYARLFALPVFDGRSFSEGEGGRTRPVYPRDAQYHGRVDPDLEPEDGPSVVRLSLERMTRIGRQHPVAALGRTGPSYARVRNLLETQSGNWIASSFPHRNTVDYKVDLDRRAPIIALRPEQREAQLAPLTQLPEDLDPRVVALAEGLVTEGMSVDDKVRAVLGHFDRGYTYSLDPLEGSSDNPLVRFLFEAKAGHCELYAGALTVMLRVVGVPARVVTGYYGGRWNDAGGYLEMSEDDAHAWVEIFHEDHGWRWVDATPADERLRRKSEALAWLEDLYKALDKLWYDKVVDFDENKRRRLVGGVKDRIADLPVMDRLLGGGGPRGGGGAGLALPIGAGALAVGLALFVWRRQRRRPEVLGLRLRRVLSKSPADNRTLAELLRDVPGARYEAARRAVALYEAWRFGPEPTPAGAGPVLEAIAAAERVKV